jgi:hypothetical protein
MYNFANQLTAKYLANLQKIKIVVKDLDFKKTLDDRDDIEFLYEDYLKFLSEYYSFVTEAKTKGKNKTKKVLILIKEFNDIIGHRII